MPATPKKLTATIEDGFLVIKVPLNPTPVRSASGKTLVVVEGLYFAEVNKRETEGPGEGDDCPNYAQELVAAASGGRARLRGQDVLDGAQDVNTQLWLALLNPKLYEPEGVTWESRNPFSARRSGVRGTIRSWARNKAGHFAARLNKRRTGVATRQISQIHDPDQPLDPPARSQQSDLEWDDLKRAIINDLEAQLRTEIEAQGPHWRARVRNLRWAVEIVKQQMAIPWEWRSMPEVAADIPGLEAGLRGGLADQLKRRIDQARRKALGEATLGFLDTADRRAWVCHRRSGESVWWRAVRNCSAAR